MAWSDRPWALDGTAVRVAPPEVAQPQQTKIATYPREEASDVCKDRESTTASGSDSGTNTSYFPSQKYGF